MNKKKEKSLKNTLRALTIVHESGGSIRPKDMAMKLWPDSDGWDHSRSCGPSGKHKGMGMYCSAGCYLGTLAKKGYLIKVDKFYQLTEEGKKHMESVRESLEVPIPAVSSSDVVLTSEIENG